MIASRPDDFDAYWRRLREELAATPACPEAEPLPLRSTDEADTFGVRITSVGPYRLYGYLSIPHGRGPFPAEVQFPRYGSVHEALHQGDTLAKRSDAVILSLGWRGMRNSDQPYAALYPGQLTDGIHEPAAYVWRGIVADCVRWLEFVAALSQVDADRVVAQGTNELPLLAAAQGPPLRAVMAGCSLFHAALGRAESADDYPLEEFNDYLRLYPSRGDAVARTLAYFEPAHHAPRITAETFLWGTEEALQPVTAALGGPVVVRASQHSSYRDGLVRERWLAERLGIRERALPEHWR